MEHAKDEQVVDVHEDEEVVESEKNEEVAEPQKEEQPLEERSAFAEQRRAREEAERKAKEAEEKLKEYEAQLSQRNETLYKSINADDYSEYSDRIPADDMANILKVAEETGADPEDAIEYYLKATENEELSRANQELEERLLEAEIDKQIISRTNEFKAIDPDFDIESLSEMGMRMMVDDVPAEEIIAYENYLKEKKAGTKPDVIGKAETNTVEKDFFTQEEVENMSYAEIKKNIDKVNASMAKW